MEKRNRLPNFTPYEETFLLSLVEEHADIIENKKTDAVAWEEKRKVWEKISLEFEVRYGVKRGCKNLKDKYENLKRMAKKSLAEEKRKIYKIGGGQYKKSTDSSVERLAALMGLSATGCKNDVDSDAAAVIASGSEAVLVENLDESVQSAQMEDFTQAPEVLHNVNSNNNLENWSSWNPAQLKKKKNEKLTFKCADGRTKKSTSNPQHIFWENEETRSSEKHKWEAEKHSWEAEKHNWEAEKHSWEKKHASLKTQILELELELKSYQQ